MKSTPPKKILHYDPKIPCCESPASGDLFPDPSLMKHGALNCGRVASVLDESALYGHESYKTSIDQEAWIECIKHPNFQSCYDLSMAKLAIRSAFEDKSG